MGNENEDLKNKKIDMDDNEENMLVKVSLSSFIYSFSFNNIKFINENHKEK